MHNIHCIHSSPSTVAIISCVSPFRELPSVHDITVLFSVVCVVTIATDRELVIEMLSLDTTLNVYPGQKFLNSIDCCALDIDPCN